MAPLNYLSGYPVEVQHQAQRLIEHGGLPGYFLKKYPDSHAVCNDGALREYTLALKHRYMKKSPPLSKVMYDAKIHAIHHALGVNCRVSRVQGQKMQRKHEIRIGSVFKRAPAALLEMIVVHELAHLKERNHDKAFYQLCEHMLPDYHQREFDMRLYLAQLEHNEPD